MDNKGNIGTYASKAALGSIVQLHFRCCLDMAVLGKSRVVVRTALRRLSLKAGPPGKPDGSVPIARPVSGCHIPNGLWSPELLTIRC